MPLTLLSKFAGSKIGALQLDASITETHAKDVKVTEHPLERGASVTDHIQALPESITISGMVSNTPLPTGSNTVKTEIGSVAELPEQPRGASSRAESAFLTLRRFMDNGEVLSVVTRLHTYDNMVLTTLAVQMDAGTGESLPFTATLRQVRFVESKRVEAEVAKDEKTKKKSLGPKKPEEATKAEVNKSMLKTLVDSFMSPDPGATAKIGGLPK